MVEQLINATISGDASLIKSLLETGLAIDAKNSGGYSALQHAIWLGNLNVIDLLINHGASVLDRNKQGNTPLHIATWCSYRDYEQVKETLTPIILLLLKNKADPNSVNYFGLTPLHQAVFYGFVEAVELMIRWQADVSIEIASTDKNQFLLPPEHWQQFESAGFKSGMDALDIAIMQKNEELISVILSATTESYS